jgi:putative ABC transport system permease protein
VKFLPLLWAGIWRKSSRTLLLILQIATAFLLFGLLQGLNSGLKGAIAKSHSDRLYVGSSVSLGVPLPISMLPQLRRVPGVKRVTPLVQLPSFYQQPNQTVPVNAVDPADFFAMFPEYRVPQAAVDAMRSHRSGAILGSVLAQRYGIHAGDHIVLQSQTPKRDGSNAWALDVLGIYEVPDQPAAASDALVSFDFVNEALLGNRDTALLYVALADAPAHGTAVSAAIDRAFANSANETRTQSEGDMFTAQLQRVADIDFIVGAIMSAVFFALLFATGALLMQSVRERVPEFAVLKTVGFSDPLVMALILLEAVIQCMLAAGLGLGIAAVLLPAASSYIPVTSIPVSVVITGICLALALACLGGAPPAWRGLRLPVAAALAER